MSRALVAMALVACLFPAAASAQEYDPQRAGHPLRIIAYIAHPAGVLLDRLIFRPAWHMAGMEPIRTLVGREPTLESVAPEPDAEEPERPESEPDGAPDTPEG